jgi:hypothetical protein
MAAVPIAQTKYHILFEGQIWNAGQRASSNLKNVTNTGLTKKGACSESTYTAVGR